MYDQHEVATYALDGLSIGVVVGSMLGYLPALAAVFTLVWTGIRIWETKTVQRWVGNEVD